MKRIICLLLACLLIAPAAFAEDYSSLTNEQLKAIISSAQAELKARFEVDHPTDPSEFLYASNGKEVRINAYVGTSTEVVIPEEIDGLPVTMLHESAFAENETITSVYIPDSITVIPEDAFYHCEKLKHVRLPQTLTEIGSSALSSPCFTGVLSLPNTLSKVGYSVFNVTGLTGLIINSSTEYMHDQTGSFTYLLDLEFVYVRAGCDPIFGPKEFMECPSLQYAIIPASVTNLPDQAFGDSPLLTIITPAGSYAETWAREHFLPVETETYMDVVTLYDMLYPD